jgi:hypothetical protein
LEQNVAGYFPQGSDSGLCLRLYCLLQRDEGVGDLELAAWTEAQEVVAQFLGSLECEGLGTQGVWNSEILAREPEGFWGPGRAGLWFPDAWMT